jgi:hypothetical protein
VGTELELISKSFNSPDETRTFPNGKLEILKFGEGSTVSIGTFQPGWHWAESVKPIVKTESCQATHRGYIISGWMHVVMEDGSTRDIGPNDAYIIPPGHDAWILGDEPCVVIEFADMTHYAKH